MSHTVEIVSQFTNLEILTKAFESFGWTVKGAGKIRTYSTDELRDVEYDHVAFNPNGKFDLGIKVIEGQYKVFGDFYDRTIAQQLGEELGLVKQKYAQCVIEEHVEEQDQDFATTILEDGTVEVKIFA